VTSSRRQLAHFMPIAKLKQVFSAKRQLKEDLAHHKCVVDQGHAVSSRRLTVHQCFGSRGGPLGRPRALAGLQALASTCA